MLGDTDSGEKESIPKIPLLTGEFKTDCSLWQLSLVLKAIAEIGGTTPEEKDVSIIIRRNRRGAEKTT
jgi:hypothetical protein